MNGLKNQWLMMLLLIIVMTHQSWSQEHETIIQGIDFLVDQNQFTGNILHYKEGSIIHHEAYGKAVRETGHQNKIGYRYNLGSICKLFTTIAIFQLIENGKLSLEDKAIAFVPELYQAGTEEITVRHLLAMESGLGDYLDNPAFFSRRNTYRSLDDYLDLIIDNELSFMPGKGNRYSNLGYELLGIIVQRVSKINYYDYVQQNIFDVSDMTKTGYFTKEDQLNDLAIGYMEQDGKLVPNWDIKIPKGTAAGGGYSTTYDMLALAHSLIGLKLLNEKNTSLLFQSYRGYNGEDQVLSIAGGGAGINATFYLHRSNKEVLVILSNLGMPSAFLVTDVFRPFLFYYD